MHVIIRGEGYSPGNNMALFGHVFKAGDEWKNDGKRRKNDGENMEE